MTLCASGEIDKLIDAVMASVLRTLMFMYLYATYNWAECRSIIYLHM